MITIIAGPRDFFRYGALVRAIYELPWKITEVVHGAASGVDTLAKRWARENGIPSKPFPADWNSYGKAAGPIRNNLMAKYGEALLALQYNTEIVSEGKRGQGTQNMIEIATTMELTTYIYRIGV